MFCSSAGFDEKCVEKLIGDNIGTGTPIEENYWGGVTDFENDFEDWFWIAVTGLSNELLFKDST